MRKGVALVTMIVAVGVIAGCAENEVQKATKVPDGSHRVPVNKSEPVEKNIQSR